MLSFPIVPEWWSTSKKHMKLKQGFKAPNYISSFDTETCYGEILTLQTNTTNYQNDNYREQISWVNSENVLDTFLKFYDGFSGFHILFGFNITFDLPLLLRKMIDLFLNDDFEVRYKGWNIKVFCTKNWFAVIQKDDIYIMLVDVRNYFQKGSLEKVAKDLKLSIGKLEHPEGLGTKKFLKSDSKFKEYALGDIRVTLEIGKVIVAMHEEFDVPMSTSFANMSEKVFRRMFILDNESMQFPNQDAKRLAELCYHGGKNAYYYDHPSRHKNIYEYDFNSAYPFAMYDLPSFVSGSYRRVRSLSDKYEGFYEVSGTIKSCKYGILYNSSFNYFRNQNNTRVKIYATSYELKEAIRSKEIKIDKVNGWIWQADTTHNPLKAYTQYFWEKKQATPKEDVHYLFYKLFLNSLYGKFIQRNPINSEMVLKLRNSQFVMRDNDLIAGGLYNPFIGALITAHCRARLHENEHLLEAIDCSTDSIKSKKYDKQFEKDYLGRMRLESYHCKICSRDYSKFIGIFVRNRLNLLICNKGHIVKGAMHGFWGNKEELLTLVQNKQTTYQRTRMPLIREGLKQEGKPLFQFFTEDRSINIDWTKYREYR